MDKFYGDKFRWFVGIVEDNKDPMKLGRVRVRITGIHSELQSDIDTSDLPWAQVTLAASEPGVSGLGVTIQLQPGAHVFGFFLDGAPSQLPMVIGVIPTVERPSSQQQRNQPNSYLNANTKSRGGAVGTGTTGERNRIRPISDEAYGAIGNSNAEIAFNFFVSAKFTPFQSAGVVGNLMQESGASLNTSIKAAGSERSYGIAQWNAAAAAGNRYGMLQEFAKDNNGRWDDLGIQLRFIIYELNKFSYLGLGDLLAAESIEAAVIAFETKYERPSHAQRSNRIAYAKDVYNRFNS